MSVVSIQNHKRVPDDNFGTAQALLDAKAILIPCRDTGDISLQGGYRMEDINEIFEKPRNPTETNEEWMFLQLISLLRQVQDETARREVSEARDRLLAIMIGLSGKAVFNFRNLDLDFYDGTRAAYPEFVRMAGQKRQAYEARSKWDAGAVHSADILELTR